VTKRRIRIQKTARPRPRETGVPVLDARDPAIIRAKERLYAGSGSRRAA